jgi:hypothetical protein
MSTDYGPTRHAVVVETRRGAEGDWEEEKRTASLDEHKETRAFNSTNLAGHRECINLAAILTGSGRRRKIPVGQPFLHTKTIANQFISI